MRRHAVRWAWVGLAACGLGGPAAGPARAQAPEGELVVREVRIEGNRAFSDRELRRAIATEPSRCKAFVFWPLCALGAFRDVRTFDPREFQLDAARLKLFYWRRGYREVQVDTQTVRRDGELDVTFRIREGEPVRVTRIALEGWTGLEPVAGDTAAMRKRLALKVGAPFDMVAVETSRSQIETWLRNRGYAHAEVLLDAFLPADAPRTAEVTFRVVPGPRSRFGAIHVLGTERVEPRTVRRLLTFRTGDLYRENEILRSQRNLYSVALFRYADVAPQLEPGDSLVDVWVRVSEANVHAVREGFGVSTSECVQVEASWAHRNFLGSARQLQLSGALSNILAPELAGRFPCTDAGDTTSAASPFNKLNWILRADFRQPWFISSRNELRLGVFAERQSLPLIYARVSYGGDLTFERQIGSRTSLTVAYRTERDSLDAGSASVFFCANFGFCLPQDVQALSEPRWLSWVSVGVFRDRTDAVFNPTRGYTLRAELEHASALTHSEYAYHRAWGDVAAFVPMGSAVWGVRLRPGWVRPIREGLALDGGARAGRPELVHPFKRFYAGGANTLRGFGQNLAGPLLLFLPRADTLLASGCSTADVDEATGVWRACDPGFLPPGAFQPRPVGGTVMLVGNLELRVPIFGGTRWWAAGFLDWGGVWREAEDFRRALDRGFLRELLWTPGLGIRYLSPVGPLRVDVGYNTQGPRHWPVVTQFVDEEGVRRVAQLETLYRYDPFEARSGLREFVNRLQLHLSIGQAF